MKDLKQQLKESLRDWFGKSKSKDGKKGWVNVVTGGSCASDEPGEGVPKCVSSQKRASMTKAERKSAARRKKAADPGQQQKSGAAKPTNVKTMNEVTNARKETKERNNHNNLLIRRAAVQAGGGSRIYGDTEQTLTNKIKLAQHGIDLYGAAKPTNVKTMNEESDKKGKGSGKKDACYSKVKSRYSVWPSAYASGALVKCRKVGAANWGNKSVNEEHTMKTFNQHIIENDLVLTFNDYLNFLMEDVSLPQMPSAAPDKKNWGSVKQGFDAVVDPAQQKIHAKAGRAMRKTKLLGAEGSNPKLAKEGINVPTYATKGLSLSPSTESGRVNTCACATQECKAACLNKAGRGAMNFTQKARLNKTNFMLDHPSKFMGMLHSEIDTHEKSAAKNGKKAAVRLNIVSDIPHESLHKEVFTQHPNVQFYDYTKIASRLYHSDGSKKQLPANYHLTLSSTGIQGPEQNWKHVRHHLNNGGVSAMVFAVKAGRGGKEGDALPTHVHDEETGKRYRVIDGDLHDHRHLDHVYNDAQPGEGLIAGLRIKGGKKMLAKAGDFAVQPHSSGIVTVPKGTAAINEARVDAYKAATNSAGEFAGDIARASKPKLDSVTADVTHAARAHSANKVHALISTHLSSGRGVAVHMQSTPEFGAEHEGDLSRHHLVTHDGKTYLVSGKKTIEVASMNPSASGFVSIMPHATRGKRSVSPIGYIPAGAGGADSIRTFDPSDIERTGFGKTMKMKVPGTMELDEEKKIVRGSAAAAIMSRLKGETLPTTKQAAEAERKLRIEQELEDAGLGRIGKPREVNEVVDNKNDMMALRYITKYSLDDIAAHDSMLANMREIPTHNMTARRAQQKENRKSLIARLDAKLGK
jgi:hypothetical protein